MIRLSAIGDVARTLPALDVLRGTFPAARIDWVVEPKSAEVVAGHPALDDVIVFERSTGRRANVSAFRALCARLRNTRYDIALDFHGVLKSGLLSAASLARERYGFSRGRAREGSWLVANRRVRLAHDRLNRVEENLELVRPLCGRRSWDTGVFVDEAVQDAVDRYFDSTFEGDRMVTVLHVPVDRPEKQWPVERFAELSDLLMGDGRFEVVLTHGPGQRDVVEGVRRQCRREVKLAPESPSLKEYAWLVHRAGLYVGGDTGPMHIAWLMGTPSVVLFGGTDPAKHAPVQGVREVLYHGDGPPARGESVEAGRRRLEAIEAEEVYDACVRVLKASKRVAPRAG
jgi:lipopolysaccharide heptosyltransferase I